METICYLLIRESTILLSLLIVFFFFFFLCHVTFAHEVLIGIFTMPMVFSPIFCQDHPFGIST